MKSLLFLFFIGLISTQAAFLRRTVSDNELFPSLWPFGSSSKSEETETKTVDEETNDIIDQLKSQNSTQNLTENAINELINATQNLANSLMTQFGKVIEHYTVKAVEKTLPGTMDVTEVVGKRIIDIALNETIKAINDGSIAGVEGLRDIGLKIVNGSHSLTEEIIMNMTNYAQTEINKKFSPTGIFKDVNRLLNQMVLKIANATFNINNITTNITESMLRQLTVVAEQMIANASINVQDQVHLASQPAIGAAFQKSQPSTAALINFGIRQVIFHTIISGQQAVNYTANITASQIKEARFIHQVANTLTAWARVNWTTGEGIVKAVKTTEKSYEIFENDLANVTSALPGGHSIAKATAFIKKVFPPAAIVFKMGRVWAKNPERFIETLKLVNTLSHGVTGMSPVAASSASFKLFKILSSDLFGSSASSSTETTEN